MEIRRPTRYTYGFKPRFVNVTTLVYCCRLSCRIFIQYS
jgi:hypothetical protein